MRRKPHSLCDVSLEIRLLFIKDTRSSGLLTVTRSFKNGEHRSRRNVQFSRDLTTRRPLPAQCGNRGYVHPVERRLPISFL
jgi:hypothetical protein